MRTAARIVCSITLVAASVSATPVDVTTQANQLIGPGDAFNVIISSANFSNLASQFGVSPYPTRVNVTFSSMPTTIVGSFTLELQSSDGSVSADFPGPVGWTNGWASNSGYVGPTSAIVDSINLTSDMSQAIFADGTAQIYLRYSGSPITVGENNRTLKQDFSVSLTGGSLTVAGSVQSVGYTDPPIVTVENSTGVPEPGGTTLMGAGLGLCAIASIVRKLLPRRDAEEESEEE
jgi:hypothetical protein